MAPNFVYTVRGLWQLSYHSLICTSTVL